MVIVLTRRQVNLLGFLFFVWALLFCFLPKKPVVVEAPRTGVFAICRLISKHYWLAMVAGAAAYWRKNPGAVTLMAVTLVVNQITLEALKILVREPRPDFTNKDSFPSGHSAAAAAFAFSWIRARLPLGTLWLAFSVLVGLSRILVGAHWIHDVVGGWALGYLITEATYRMVPFAKKAQRGSGDPETRLWGIFRRWT
ncbi:MAG: phosphatase PAP2 family protein [Armatimonadetes bacterium]|nr:phosphatase PAP2 family protein [Armatimonadota bacterium]MDW8122020.1 phosphatase PAP2 family protein [Armatimonadota bacterium]